MAGLCFWHASCSRLSRSFMKFRANVRFVSVLPTECTLCCGILRMRHARRRREQNCRRNLSNIPWHILPRSSILDRVIRLYSIVSGRVCMPRRTIPARAEQVVSISVMRLVSTRSIRTSRQPQRIDPAIWIGDIALRPQGPLQPDRVATGIASRPGRNSECGYSAARFPSREAGPEAGSTIRGLHDDPSRQSRQIAGINCPHPHLSSLSSDNISKVLHASSQSFNQEQ